MKKILLAFFLLHLFPLPVSAQIVINELGVLDSPDWIEIYNLSSENIELGSFKIVDEADNAKNLTGTLNAGGFVSVDWSNRLNNSGDVIKIVRLTNGEIVDQIAYGKDNSVCNPESSQSIGRYPDGNATIDRFISPTKGGSNNSSLLSPCPSPTQSPTNTHTPTPKPSKTVAPKPTTPPIKTDSVSEKPTPSSEVLQATTISGVLDEKREEENLNADYQVLGVQGNPEEKDSVSVAGSQKKNLSIATPFFIAGGLLFLSASVISFFRNKKRIEGFKHEENS